MKIKHPVLGDFRIQKELGGGKQANIFIAESEAFGFRVAMKMLKRNVDAAKEVEIAQQVSSPYVLTIFDHFEDVGEQFIMMEYVDGEPLLDNLVRRQFIPEGEAKLMFKKIAAAIRNLHKNNIVHRDIKLENIILDKSGNIRLIDFDFAKQNNNLMTTLCGSPSYSAPEIILRRPYTQAVDIWAMGVVLYALTIGQFPFNGTNINEIFHEILEAEPLIPMSLSNELQQLLHGLLNKIPERRLSMDHIMEHPWLKDVELPDLETTDVQAMTNIDMNLDFLKIENGPTRNLLSKIFKCSASQKFLPCFNSHQIKKGKLSITKEILIPRRHSLNDKKPTDLTVARIPLNQKAIILKPDKIPARKVLPGNPKPMKPLFK